MVAVPYEGGWSLRSMADRDRQRLLTFLRKQPLINIFFTSKTLDEGIGGSAPVVEVSHGGAPICVASVSSNIVLAADPDASEDERDFAVSMLAQYILGECIPVRAIISEAVLVESLWKRLLMRIDPPTVVRLNQPIYAIERPDRPYPDLRAMRFATLRDLDLLVPACAAMHREEVGIDPLDRDAVSYRKRIRDLIQRQRALIRMVDGKIAFKCEYSAVAPEGIQLMGVWTAPEYRRRGFAHEGLQEVCGHILHENRAVTLFVNDFNLPAIALYERLGFRKIGTNRALIW